MGVIVNHVDPWGIPVVAGLCRYCRRTMWKGTARDGTRGLLPACVAHPGACNTCGAWMSANPGRDPRDARGSKAETLPVERAEDAPGWRNHPGRRCAGEPPLAFEPEPDEDEDDEVSRSLRLAVRRETARALCGSCPVARLCRNAAGAHGYEGLWGGWLFTPDRCTDLVSDEHRAAEVAA